MYFLLVSAAILAFSSLTHAGPNLGLFSQGRGPAVVPVGQGLVPATFPIDSVSFKPYEFGYELGDGLGMSQHRREVADGSGSVKGSYGYLDPLGVTRLVEYIADNNGYRAVVRSNEPGLAGQNAADAVFLVQPPPPAAVAQGIRRLTPIVSV